MSIAEMFVTPWVRTLICVFCLLIAGLIGGYTLTRNHYESLLAAANQEIGSLKSANLDMADAVKKQNAAIDALQAEAKRRQAQAKISADKAKAESVQSQKRAQAVLLSKPPAGADMCEAARAAFDDELRAERGAK